jgi:hypothetical protein
MRIVPGLLLVLSAPLAAQQAVPDIPQPVVLDWGEDFRLYAPPKNIGSDGLKKAAAEESRQRIPPPADPKRAPAVLGPEDSARDRYSTRRIETGDDRLNVKAPVSAGPVSVGASYGKYRAIPNIPTREVSADDMRVSLGIAF